MYTYIQICINPCKHTQIVLSQSYLCLGEKNRSDITQSLVSSTLTTIHSVLHSICLLLPLLPSLLNLLLALSVYNLKNALYSQPQLWTFLHRLALTKTHTAPEDTTFLVVFFSSVYSISHNSQTTTLQKSFYWWFQTTSPFFFPQTDNSETNIKSYAITHCLLQLCTDPMVTSQQLNFRIWLSIPLINY